MLSADNSVAHALPGNGQPPVAGLQDQTRVDALLQASRRVDWRFLLPDPNLGEVAYLGPAQTHLWKSLRLFSAALTRIENAATADHHPAQFDVVVVSAPSPARLQQAARLVRPGGYVYVEARRRWGRSPGDVVLAMRQCGLVEAEAYWHWPDFETCAEIVPLGDPAAVRHTLGRRGSGGAARLKSALGRALLRSGLLTRLVPCFSIVARRQARGRERMNTVLTFLESNWTRLDLARHGTPDRLSCVVVTPRFRASSHVVFLLLAKDRPDPVLVAKVPRLGEAGASLQREVANLRAIQAGRPSGLDSVPRVVAFEEYARHPILIETALVGQPMDRSRVRRDPAGCCEAVLAWLTEVGRSHLEEEGESQDWFERLVAQPLDQLARAFPASAEESLWLNRTRDLVAPLQGTALSLVVEHGDLSHPNLLLLDGGGLGVIDWELAEPRGLPACDLFFFLSYAAFARSRASKNRECVSAFHAAFFGPSAWARPYVRAYAERLRLPPHVLTPLFVVCWVRYLTGLLIRLGEADRSGHIGAETAAWLRANRYYALWRHMLARVNELQWYGA